MSQQSTINMVQFRKDYNKVQASRVMRCLPELSEVQASRVMRCLPVLVVNKL